MNPHHGTPTTSGFRTGIPWGAGLIGAIATCLWLGAPAQGSTLNDWQFDPQTQQLTVTLPDGVTPNYFLLAEPARIVLNLPSTELGAVQPAQYYNGPIQSIRVSQFDAESARVVVEFAPNTVLDPRHAELSSHDLAGGTLWTLRPLVVDSPVGTTVTLAPNASSAAASSTTTTAYTAVAGATVQAPTYTAPTYTADDGIRTDASALIDGGTATGLDQPPNTLPIDPFAVRAEPQVSVPPLADSAIATAPIVTVPPLADRPEVAPQPEAPAVAVPTPAPQALAQTSPSSEPDISAGVALEIIPAPQPEVVVPEPVAPPSAPVMVTPQALPSQTVAPVVEPLVESQPAVAPTVPVAPLATPVAPPEPSSAAVSTPAAAAPAATAIAPPFLEGTAAAASTAPTVPTERRSIPPPPEPSQPEGTIPFGAPLPDQAKSISEGTAIAAPPSRPQPRSFLPVGTLLSLQYAGSVPLVLDQAEPLYEVLILAEDVMDAQTGQLLLASGSQVLGQFEGFDNSGRRYATAPQLVTIQPGQIIVVEVVNAVLPFQIEG